MADRRSDEVPYLHQRNDESVQGDNQSPQFSFRVDSERNSNGGSESIGAKTSSNASENGSQSSAALSPTLHPAQANAMNSSIISALDLGEERAFPSNTSETNEGPQSGDVSTSAENQDTLTSEMNGTYDAPTTSSSSSLDASSSSVAPLAPRDVLSAAPRNPTNSSLASSQSTLSIPESTSTTTGNRVVSGASNSSFQEGDISGFSFAGGSTIGANTQLGDDSALNALMEAHSSESPSHNRPNKRDASFGLDPDVDTHQSIKGQPIIPNLLASPLRAVSAGPSHHHHHHHTHHSHEVEGEGRHHGFSHTTASTGAPSTMETGLENTKTVPSVSATGVPRFLPRRTSRSRSRSINSSDEKRNSLGHRRNYSSSTSSSEVSAPREMQAQYSPSGSLTIALFTPGLTWRRRSYLLLASMVINIGLPFINGIALGFGEIFARSLIAPWLGFAPAALNINAPAARRQGSGNTSGVGLRNAGSGSNDAANTNKEGRRR